MTQLSADCMPSSQMAPQFRLAAKFDSVYFFMWPGWPNELESNRWHWSKRWARWLPVVLIQPELAPGKPALAVPEKRLANVELLSMHGIGL
jgi:hypothetical protein